MIRRVTFTAVWMFAAALPAWSEGAGYHITKGGSQICQAFLDRKNDIRYAAPTVHKGDPRWAKYRERCPMLLTKEQWMAYRNRDFDDYALYSMDVDNDGEGDTVLYRRHDKPYFVTHQSADGSQYRKQNGIEVTEEFFKVDLASCKMEPVYRGHAKTELVSLDGVTYIQNVNARDRGKTLAIYKKVNGVALQGSYQDDICRFQR